MTASRFSAALLGGAMMFAVSLSAFAENRDPSIPDLGISASPAKSMFEPTGAEDPCRFGKITSPLDLPEVVERALCYNPQTRQAWANVKAAAAQIGINRAAYLPSVSATLNTSRQNSDTSEEGYVNSNYDVHMTTHDDNLQLNWTIFDFGSRDAKMENARQLLIAANASQDATLQQVFVSAAEAYYNVLSTQSELAANYESEKSAKESYLAAEAKYKSGVGTLADKLQAQTNYAQATLNRVKAAGESKNAFGELAIAIGLNANTAFALQEDDMAPPKENFMSSVDELIDGAIRTHPNMLAAQAQLKAAKESVKVAKSDGLPSLSLVGSLGRNDQLEQSPVVSVARSSSIGIQLTVPLFEGFGRSYQIQAAKVQVESKEIDLANAEMQVSLDVWKSYQTLATETEDLKATDELLRSATQSYDVARGRYQAGIGNILDLLNAQSTLAAAKQQRIQALSSWHIARLKLAASLGKIHFIEKTHVQ